MNVWMYGCNKRDRKGVHMEKTLMGIRKKTNRPIVLASIMLAMFMGAIERRLFQPRCPR